MPPLPHLPRTTFLKYMMRKNRIVVCLIYRMLSSTDLLSETSAPHGEHDGGITRFDCGHTHVPTAEHVIHSSDVTAVTAEVLGARAYET
jgi:hypothetical protein